MAKKKNNKIINFIAFALGLLAAGSIFLAALSKGDGDGKTFYTGIDVAFGKTGIDFGAMLKAYFPFDILVVLGYLLPLVAGVLMLLAGKKDKILKLLAGLLFIGGAVLIFLMPQYVKVVIDSVVLGTSKKELFAGALAYGAIISGSLSALGALTSAYSVIK